MRRASVYFRSEAIYVVAVAVTGRGITIDSDRVIELDRHTSSPHVLGMAVIDALDAYQEGVPELSDWRDHAKPMLRATGFKSLGLFEKGACFIGISEEEGEVTILPTAAMKRGGFIALSNVPNGGQVKCTLDAEEIGHALFGRLPFCTATIPALSQRDNKAQKQGKGTSRGQNDLQGDLLDVPIPFGYKTAWIAVRGQATKPVADALELVEQQLVNWKEGMQQAKKKVFVSPPVAGWTFVLGSTLPDAGNSNWLPLLIGLSQKMGEVLYFGTHRVSGYQAWARIQDGRAIRAFGDIVPSSGGLSEEIDGTTARRVEVFGKAIMFACG